MRPLTLVLAALAAAGCDQRPDPAALRTVSLARCRLPGVSAQVQCGEVEVYEDRQAASGRKLKLFVAVAPALASSPRPDPLFILAGGPGQGATEVAPVVLPALERIRRNRDIVFLDQRGTGRSHKLACDLVPEDAGLAERLNADFDPAPVKRCRDALEADHDLVHYTTPTAMDDLDQVRRALGYGPVNLWGGSYGTRAALVYMRRHPDQVRTAILDGVAPMSLYLPRDMARDADRSLRLLFEACEADARCKARYPELGRRFEELLERLETPLEVTLPHPVTGKDQALTLTREVFTRILRALLYRPEATILVPLTVDRALAGDFRPFVAQAELVEGGFAQELAVGMFFSVVCSEDVPFIDFEAARAAAEGTFLGPGFAEEMQRACALWPKAAVPEGYREPVRSAVPTLLFSGDLDPVTPPRWGEAAHQHLPHSVHVEVPATGHGTLGNACVRELMEAFLETGTVKGLTPRCDEGTRTPFFTSFAGPPP